MNGCHCCSVYSEGYVLSKSTPLLLGIDLDVAVSISDDLLYVAVGLTKENEPLSNYEGFSTLINYCPMCGRKLESSEE